MARNRKRAKERRARRPQPVATNRIDREETPEPLTHAAPDVELAIGRQELADEEERGFAEPLVSDEPEELDEPAPEPIGAGGGRGRVSIGADFDGDASGGGGGPGATALPRPGGLVEPRVTLLARLIGFLQGSWRELQRVQWPDRRQVAQATSVVIGFVIVAGVFLGLCDLAFSHLVDYVLYGK